MNELVIVQLGRDALRTALSVAGPALIVSMVVGLSVSLFQVVTSLQDQTVAFVPKVLAVMIVIVLAFPWMVRVLTSFAARMFTEFNDVTRMIQ